MSEKIPLWLNFADRSLEAAFQRHYDRYYRSFTIGGLLVGVVVFSGFGLLDLAVFADDWKTLWWWRYLFGLPVMGFTLLALWIGSGYRWIQPLVAFSVCLLGLGMLGMFLELPASSYSYFYSGLMLVIFYAHAFLRLRFAWVTLSTLLLFLANEIVVLLLRSHIPWDQRISGQIFIGASILGGMAASYFLERDARSQFLLQRELIDEQQRLEGLNSKLEQLSRQDELTGIANRRGFMEELEHAWREQARHLGEARPLSLLLLDVDHFKKYNDRYGHPAGDRCLQRVADVLAGFARRPRDLAARLGGEEFVLLLPETDIEEALHIAESLRQAVLKASPECCDKESPGVTVSIGVASRIPVGDLAFEALFKEADEALYRAKREGRNRVVTAH